MKRFFCGGHSPGSQVFKRILWGIVTIVLSLNFFAVGAFAAWDGQGASGNENSASIVGDYSMPYANTSDILGYRFTVYDANGDKIGYTVDIDRKTHSYDKIYRTSYGSKLSHIDLYRKYLTYSNSSNTVALGYVTSTDSDDWVFYDSSLPSTPTSVENWLTEAKARDIAKNYCEAADYDYATSYIIVEPIVIAKLDGDYYAMTVAEYAVYQSSLYGWTGLGDQDGGVEGTYRYALMRALSGYFGRYLYAVLEYDVLGTEPVSPSFLQDDAKGTPSVLMSGSTRYNTAANILTYQVGMAVYTGQKADNSYILTVDPNGGTWEGSTSKQTFEMVEDQTKTIPNPTRDGYTFVKWTVSGGGSLSGTTYTQGTSDCTITAQWSKDATIYTNTIAFFAGEFSNGEGNGTDTNWLYVGEKTFTAENGSSVTMNAARSITVPHGHSLMTTFGTSGLTGS